MDIAAWIVTGVVALILGGAGVSKLTRSKGKILENPNMGWANDFSPTAIKLIGLAESPAPWGWCCPGL